MKREQKPLFSQRTGLNLQSNWGEKKKSFIYYRNVWNKSVYKKKILQYSLQSFENITTRVIYIVMMQKGN